MKSKLTSVILTKNEEENIEDCIKSLRFCHEVIIIDDNSIDKTTSLAKKFGAIVIERTLNNDFASQRNYALTKAKNEWVLFIDADERVNESLANDIVKAIDLNKYDGYNLKRIDNLWGKKIKHGETGNIKLLRLGKKKAGKWERSVHEIWKIDGRTSELKNPIIHYPHKTLADFIKHIETYSNLHALENIKEGKESSVFKIILMPIAHFVINYIFKLGFLDGIEGFIIAFLMSFHSFLAWSKMYVKFDNTS